MMSVSAYLHITSKRSNPQPKQSYLRLSIFLFVNNIEITSGERERERGTTTVLENYHKFMRIFTFLLLRIQINTRNAMAFNNYYSILINCHFHY